MPAISAIISPESINPQASADDKSHALEQLSELLSQNHPELNENEVLGSLIRRERLGSTGVGHGVAIPHGRIGGLDNATGALLILDKAIDFDANDNQPVDLLFALMVPADCTETHLQLLAQIAEMLTDDSLVAQLREAESADAVLEVINNFNPQTDS